MSKSDRKMRIGHVAKKEYSGSVKTCAVGRRKQCGHSYICPCCIHRGGMRTFSAFKKMSHRHVRRTNKDIQSQLSDAME